MQTSYTYFNKVPCDYHTRRLFCRYTQVHLRKHLHMKNTVYPHQTVPIEKPSDVGPQCFRDMSRQQADDSRHLMFPTWISVLMH